MNAVYGAGMFLGYVWKSATDRDRSALLVCLLFAGMTVVSLMFSTGLDAINRLCWLAAFVVAIWSQVSSIMDRALQSALTHAFLVQTRGGGSPTSRVTFEHAGMKHVWSGDGWQKVVRD